MTTKYSVTDC